MQRFVRPPIGNYLRDLDNILFRPRLPDVIHKFILNKSNYLNAGQPLTECLRNFAKQQLKSAPS